MITRTSTETILVADECERICEIIELLLGPVGYRVLTASNGNDALHLARRNPRIDLFMVCAEMPGMPVGELTRRFAAIHPAASLILVADGDYPIETPEPFDRLIKPFTVGELRGAVRRALCLRRIGVEEPCAA